MFSLDQATWKPRVLDVEITQRCNLGCAYCYLGQPGQGQMSEATAWKIVQLQKRVPIGSPLVINLYGGEPFRNFSLIRYLVSESYAQCTVFTNGATATAEQLQWCHAWGVRLQRSTAGCPEAAALTRPGDYTDRWLQEGRWWRDYGATHRLVVTPATAQYLVPSVLWLHQNGFYGPVDIQTDDYVPWPPEARETFQDGMLRLAQLFVEQYRQGRVLGIENFTNFGRSIYGQAGLKVIGCGAGWNTMGITWDGQIVPCHRFFRDRSVLSETNLDAIVAGEAVRFPDKLVEVIQGWSEGREREECLACDAQQCCPRGCLHVSQQVLGRLDGSPEIRCLAVRAYARMARLITKMLGTTDWWNKPATPCAFTREA